MTMIKRTLPNEKASLAFTSLEMKILDRLVETRPKDSTKKNISDYVGKLARLGGYLARSGDSPPGNSVMWKGLSRLTDIEIGFELAQSCG